MREAPKLVRQCAPVDVETDPESFAITLVIRPPSRNREAPKHRRARWASLGRRRQNIERRPGELSYV